MRLNQLKIMIAHFGSDEVPEGSKRIIASSNDYPVRNGSGNTVDEAVEDLCLQIILHLHNRRSGRTT